MSDNIMIRDHCIGAANPVFIIAEIGVNHNGDVTLAKEMIRRAAECGADCVKFQTFSAEEVVTQSAPKACYQLKTTPADESQIDMLKKLEMPFDCYDEIISCCREHGVVFMSTPYNTGDVDMLEKLGAPAFKLASIHAAEPSFASYTAQKGKPVILSTGMATLAEVDQTVRAMWETGNTDIILLQCTTNYPSRYEDTNLLAMKTMGQAFKAVVGYSDHTPGEAACIAAVALGAKVIEKHFTTDKSLPGPDQTTSADPYEFRRLVEAIRTTELMLGSGIKEPCEIEKQNAVGMRRSIVSRVAIKKGETIDPEMFGFKRPATGLSPSIADQLSGKIAKVDIPANSLIQWSQIGD